MQLQVPESLRCPGGVAWCLGHTEPLIGNELMLGEDHNEWALEVVLLAVGKWNLASCSRCESPLVLVFRLQHRGQSLNMLVLQCHMGAPRRATVDKFGQTDCAQSRGVCLRQQAVGFRRLLASVVA